MEDHKKHRAKKAGPKAERKKDKKLPTDLESAKKRNPKAFAIQSAIKAAKKFHRSQDVKTKKIHIPLPDRSVLEPPPVVVGIVGPPKVGKTTLLHCIVKNFTRQKLTNVQGPVTLVSGKKRRLTLIECDNQLNNMIDLAKVADLVILMIDASFGFEMEIFEFLNICQVHGFPRVMGVLNHLDTFNDNKRIRKTKKRLKDRFWTEIYQGAKLFYLSGMVEGEYQKTEIHNLCRFISVMKFRPLTWRCSHPYILADRMEDITPPDEIERNSKCDRHITLYGYNRGMALKKQQAIHLAGVGDFRIADVEHLPDPCPTPEMEKRRTLSQKERLVYAPMSGVGGILYDKDAVYIDVGGSHHFDKEETEEMTPVKELLSALMGPSKTGDESDDDEDKRDDEDDEKSDDEDLVATEELFAPDGRIRRKAVFKDDDTKGGPMQQGDSGVEDSGSEDEDVDMEEDSDEEQEVEENDLSKEDQDEEEGEEDSDDDEMDDMEEEDEETADDSAEGETDGEEESERKTLGHEEAAQLLKKRWEGKINYHSIVYGESDDEGDPDKEEEDEEEIGGMFRVLKKKMEADKEDKYNADLVDSSKFPVTHAHDWQQEEVRQLIADCFVTGRWGKDEDFSARLAEDDEVFGDFEDLETGEKHTADAEESDEDDGDKDSQEEGDETIGERKKTKAEMTAEERRDAKRKRRKAEFDARYDNRIKDDDEFYQAWKSEMEEQAKLNRSEFEDLSVEMRTNMEGYRPGLYLRVEVTGVPCEFVQCFDPCAPLVIGGLTNMEENVGYVQTRFKKHRWYKKVLKTRNPLILSVGWRRFQTIALFSKLEDNMRCRMLKYTPPHLHCLASYWGPITPQGSGVLALENINEISRDFRIAGTGVVLELDKSVEIVKKLKLTGTPVKIMQKTAYIQGMFNSQLEVAKFEGADIKTVSSVRGTIKKGVRRLAKTGQTLPPGTFRATFEDRILLSDIVFLTAWYPVKVPQFYNPVTSLLGQWTGMKTVGQLRHQRNIAVPLKEDSLYKPVERKVRRSAPLVIPRALQKELPFKVTPKNLAPPASALKRVPVINEPSETKKARFLQKLKVVHEFNMRNRHAIMRQRAHAHQEKIAKRAAEKEKQLKQNRSDVYRVLGKMEKAKAARDRSRAKASS